MLREQEAGGETADVCRKHGITAATFYKFKAKFGGMEVFDARRLKSLDDENVRLKKLPAEQMLTNAILKDVAAKNGDARRKAGAVVHACEMHGGSQRRACQALRIDRSTVRHTSTRPDDAPLREAIKAVAAERRRIGYRRIHVMLDRQAS